MSDRATAMNPRVLQWARERTGLSVSDAAGYVGRSPETLAAWEDGSEVPTFRQLEALAKAFKRPVAVFFFPAPPIEPELAREFRTLPEAEIEELDPDTRVALREGRAWQESLRELTNGRNPAQRKIFRDIRASTEQPVEELASHVRDYLGVSIEQQQSWPNPTLAFKEWRRAVEGAGVFVFKRSFSQRTISGFCLHDDEFPVIMVNNSTAHSRQIFTLFHELAHVLFHVSGVTRGFGGNVNGLAPTDRALEVACNQFGAEFLVPDLSFPWEYFGPNDLPGAVASIADRYNVSREVVLRKLMKRGLVTSSLYRDLADLWNREYEEGRGGGSGGNYYATQATYFGENYLKLAFGQYRAGRVSLPELADHLGMKARNIGKLEDFLLARR
jgi:Zn-dependent peptidase ImmA (M78 family)/DNA-binding XRE family transcriptional regulator